MFHKAKECYVRDRAGSRYLDLRRPDNISGHSHRKLTTPIKDAVSTLLTLDLPTAFHKRYRKLLQPLTHDGEYELCYFSSVLELLLKVSVLYGMPHADTHNIADFLSRHGISNGKEMPLYDFTLKNEFTQTQLHSISWYYHYPRLIDEINFPETDIIVLPALYTGYTGGASVLVHRRAKQFLSICSPLEEYPAIIFVTATAFYYRAKALQNQQCFHFSNDKFSCNDRVFAIKQQYLEVQVDTAAALKSAGVLINTNAPYYNYIPLTLDQYEIQRLKKALENC